MRNIKKNNNILFTTVVLFLILFISFINSRKLKKTKFEYFENPSPDVIKELICYEPELPKTRIGRNYDGGYVIVDNLKYDLLIGCGISNDDSFEHDFLSKNKNIECYAFDGTVNDLPNFHPKIHFIKKNIGPFENKKNTNLHKFISEHKNIFLKMDIEGAEYDWIDNLPEHLLKNMKQMVIEFHATNKWGIWDDYKVKCLNKINKTHYLVHAHGNNNKTFDKINNINIPQVIECTYLRKDRVLKKNKQRYPTKYDMPNKILRDELSLNHYPFVN